MSKLSDALSFEMFNLKDMWKNIKKDPKRLVLGVDPASTWVWNKVLGRDDKPIVDQLGGPYGGKAISVGPDQGGVYQRAQDAGINTGPGRTMHDIAHVIAAFYGANGLYGAMPPGENAPAGGGNPWQDPNTYMNMPTPGGQQQQPTPQQDQASLYEALRARYQMMEQKRRLEQEKMQAMLAQAMSQRMG